MERTDYSATGYSSTSRGSTGYSGQGYAPYGQRGYDRDEDRYGNRDDRRNVAIDETTRLIASNKVEGTAVYDRDGDRLGSIYNFMVDKKTGRVEYAVLTFGGFLGMGQNYYPLPWEMLTYDTEHGGYMVEMDEDDLHNAPSYRQGYEPDYDERYGRFVNSYYGVPF